MKVTVGDRSLTLVRLPGRDGAGPMVAIELSNITRPLAGMLLHRTAALAIAKALRDVFDDRPATPSPPVADAPPTRPASDRPRIPGVPMGRKRVAP